MAERELAILIRARDLASKTIRGVKKEISSLGSTAAAGAKTAAYNLARIGVAGAGLAVILGAGAVKAAGDFEASLNTINTVAQTTPEKLKAIGDGIRQIARDTGAPLEDLTQGFYDLVSAGIDAGQALKVLSSSNTLAIGGLATAAEGVDLLTTALNSYGVAADQQGATSQRFADIFAKSIERGKVTAAELASSFAEIGPLAATNKIEIEELAAAYATMTKRGIPAGQAATFMSAALISLTRRTGQLEKLEKQTGKSYLAIAGKQGLAFAFEQLRKDAAKAGVPLIDLVGRQEALQFALSTTGDAFAGYNDDLAAMNDANGTAAKQMSERQKGLNFQLARLKALAIDAGITIGNKLIPKLIPLAEKAVAFLTTHEADIERFGDKIAGGFDKALQFAERIPWSAIGSGLQTAATWAGKLMDVFLGLPPEVQTTIIALAALNKLSGGAVGGIASELGKGLIKGVLGMTAGVVNINAGVVNGPGGGGGVNPGTVAGGIGLAASAAGTIGVAIVGVTQAAASALTGSIITGLGGREAGNKAEVITKSVGQGPLPVFGPFERLFRALGGDLRSPLEQVDANTKLIGQYVKGGSGEAARLLNVANERGEAIRAGVAAEQAATDRVQSAVHNSAGQDLAISARNQAAAFAIRDRVSSAGSITAAAVNAARGAIGATTVAARAAGQQTAAAVRDKDLSVHVTVPVTTNISIRDLGKRITYKNKAGMTAS